MKAAIYNYNDWVELTEPAVLKQEFEKLLVESGFQILNFMEHHFQPQGYTALWLLAESHFALHSFPEEGKTYLELSSCDLKMYEDFLENLKYWKLHFLKKAALSL